MSWSSASRRAVVIALGCLVSGVLTVGRAEAGWSATVNGLGFGTTKVDVWCFPNAPPAAPSFTATATGFSVTSALGPALPGCNPLTQVSASIGPLWNISAAGVAAGGDSISDLDLLPLVHAVSPVATISLSVSAMVTGPSATYTITWSGSDAGTAQRIEWFDSTNGLTEGALLDSVTKVGPFSGTFSRTETSTSGDAHNIILQFDGIALSTVPEPSSLALMGIAASLGLGYTQARRRLTRANRPSPPTA